MSVRLLALALLVVGCRSREAPPKTDLAGTATAVETWSLTPASRDEALAFPAPCSPLGPTLQSVVPPDARLLASMTAVGELVVATPSPQGTRLVSIRMESGLAPAVGWGDSASLEEPLAVGPPWMVVGTSQQGQRVSLRRGPTEPLEELTQGEGLRVLSARSGEGRAAVLVRDRSEALTVFAGPPSVAAAQWARIAVDAPDGGGPLAKLVSVEPDNVVLALAGHGGVVWHRVGERGTSRVAALSAAGGALDAELHEGRAALLAPTLGVAVGEGGTRLELEGAPPVALRSPTLAKRGWLRSIEGGLVALWLAAGPDGGADRLHAVVVASGVPIGPVTMVGEATDVAMTSRGSRIDVWLRTGTRVRHASAECHLTDRKKGPDTP